MGKWDESEEAKQYRINYNKQNYDTVKFECRKGLKKIFQEELKKDDLTIAGFLTDAIMQYLYKNGYSEKEILSILGKKKADV